MAKRIDPVTGAPIDWSADPRNPAYSPGVAEAYDVKSSATFGDPLPVVYGTAKVPGRLVWMRDQAAVKVGWKYDGKTAPPRFDCVSPAADLVVAAGSTTTVIVLKDGGGAPVAAKPYLNQRIYFRSCADSRLNGLSRLITIAGAWPLSPYNATLDSALPYTPVAGDIITIGPSLLARTADAIFAICEAPVTSILRYWRGSIDPQFVNKYLVAHDAATVEVVTAATAGTWPGMQAVAESVGMTLTGTVQFRAANLLLEDGKAPDLSFEVKGSFIEGTTDANPADVVVDMLTRAGIPSTSVDVEAGTDGAAASSYRRYCSQMGFLVSRALTSQAPWASYLEELLDQTNSVAIWSGSKLRIVPLGDETVGTYVPPAVVVALGVDDFQFDKGADPITVQRKPDTEVWNAYSVTYQDRAADYSPVAVEYIDPADSTTTTIRRASKVEGTWITNATHAQKLASIKAQRSIGIRNIFTFRILPRVGALLEPMDFVSLTEPKLGLSGQVCRIKSVSEDEQGELTIEAYEWPAGIASPVVLATQAYEGYAASASLTPAASSTPADNSLALLALANLANVTEDSVTQPLIAPSAVGTTEIADAAVTAGKLAVDSLATTDYAETAGVPTAGVKMQSSADLTAVTAMARSTAYSVGNIRKNASGLMYRCITAGTTAASSEPTTTGADITDGSCHWATYSPLRIGSAGMQLGSMLIDEVQAASMRAIARSSSDAGLVWYRGNSTGAPVTYDATYGYTRVSLYSFGSYSVTNMFASTFELELQPKLDTDNFDSLRYAKVEIWGGVSALYDTMYVTIPDRRFENATASNAANKVRLRINVLVLGTTNYGFIQASAPYHFSGYVRVYLFNSIGYSAPVDFYVGGITNGSARGTQVTSSSYHLPSGTNPPSGGGGYSGGSCLSPETVILLTQDGTTAPLHALKAGDMVWTRPEGGGDFGYHRIESALLDSNLRQRVSMTDGRSFICSVNHLINVNGIWRRADSLQVGEEMAGTPSGFIKSVEYLGEGPVVKLTIPTAGTYYGADGLWQHNAMKEG